MSERDLLERIDSPTLRAAAERVAAAWDGRPVEALDAGEVSEQLAWLTRAVESPDDDSARARGIELALRSRLLDLLRAELLDEWKAEPPPDPAEMLALLDSFERVRESLEPDWEQSFSSRLLGPNGLGLVVEVAHDLRSPLTSILFLSETLRRGQSGDVNDIQSRQLGLIYSAALGLVSVVGDVIELARGGDTLTDSDPIPFSVSGIIESVRDIVQPVAEEKGLTIRLRPPETPDRVGHPVPLSRTLLNLTNNALKFTEEGSVELVAREVGPKGVEFSVRDTGPGIPPEVQEMLYEPFRRTRAHEGHEFSGSGLGLVIARKLVEAMGSTLEFETRPDWGTRFSFALDLDPATHL